MLKAVIIIEMALWLCLAGVLAVNIQRQYRVSRLQQRVLNDYKQISEINPFFQAARDSLFRDIQTASSQSKDLLKPFPLPSREQNWLFMRLAVIALTVFSIITFWFYYKKPTS